MIESHDFPYITEKVKLFEPIINQYEISDAAMAVFCISVCVDNRSALEITLALNWAITNHNLHGTQKIENYEQFSAFFDKISSLVKVDPFWDYFEEDFGDVTIDVFGSKYSVILGTGHNMVFACLQFLPYLAQELGREEDLVEVLSYSSGVIDTLRDKNYSDGNHEIRFVIPNKELFDEVNKLFNELLHQNLSKIAKLVDSNIIEKKHFVDKNGIIIPLFNTSILIDLYDSWYKTQSDAERIEFINRALTGITLSLSKLERDINVSIMCPLARTEGPGVSQRYEQYSFALITRKGVILAVNSGEYKDEDINNLYDEVIDARDGKGLFLTELISRSDDKKLRGITIDKNTPVHFLIFKDWANPEEDCVFARSKEEHHFRCTALDVVYYLFFMHDADELFDYICYKENGDKAQIVGFGGDASTFITWQQSGHMFAKGAVEYGLIDVGYNTENEYVVDYYRNKLKGFPFGRGDYILDNPFAWDIQEKENSFYQYMLKGGNGFGGLFCPFSNGCYFFFPLNVEFFNGLKEYMEYKDIILVFEDLIQRMLSSLRSSIEEYHDCSNCAVQVMMVPYEYAKKSGMSSLLLNQERKYVYSDAISKDNKTIIRYVPIIDKIFEAISSAKTRTEEVDVFLEIFEPLRLENHSLYKLIKNKADSIRTEKKEIAIRALEIEYKWNREEEKNFYISDEAYNQVRKHIAIVCYKAGIKPGKYYGKDATAVVRSIQKQLISDFEDEVSKYDYIKLFERTLAIYATLVHMIFVHRKRYEIIGDVKDSVKDEVSQTIIKQREEAKHNSKVSLYLLETALFLRERGSEQLNIDVEQYLLAYANWLVVLNDDADMCYFTEKEVCVEVSSEYIIDVSAGIGLQMDSVEGLSKRLYDNPGFLNRDFDEDSRCFERVKSKFQFDTKISLEHYLSFLYYLETGGCIDKELSFKNNVLCVWKDDILNDFSKIEKISYGMAELILEFVNIIPDKLKTQNGKHDFYLPIGEKEKRDNRFEVKPVYEYDDMIIYSPSVIHALRKYWQNSLFDFCMPYEIGMPETKKALDDWKRVYEKKIVFDLEKVFKEEGFLAWHNLELKKIKKGKYPDYLGDYDVFAVNLLDREVWIVECKVLEKVETFYEMYRQQNRFFNEEKYDEKFQRRIDFLNRNYNEVLNDLNLPAGEYSIKSFMCVNKVFASRYKEIAFPILSYSEMENTIREGKIKNIS